MLRTQRLPRMVVSVLVLLLASHARAANARLELDSFSFFFFEGASVGAQVPGTTVPIQVTKVAPSQWNISVAPSDFSLPEITYPSGRRVRWKLSNFATGSISRTPTGFACTLSAPAVAYVDGATHGIPMTFAFTTEVATSQASGVTASRQGARLDPTSGYVQLVAAGVHAADAETAPGKPFYVVLSGRVLGFDFQK